MLHQSSSLLHRRGGYYSNSQNIGQMALRLGRRSTNIVYRLKGFLKMLVQGREDVLIYSSRLDKEQKSSGPMWESWRSGDFWANYVARKNFAFDSIYWQKLDPRFFGSAEVVEIAWEKRVDLLDKEGKQSMGSLVQRKIQGMKERKGSSVGSK